MKKYAKNFLFTAFVATLISGSANAHRLWLLPSTFTLSGKEQWVTVDGAISNNLFFPNHVAMDLVDIHVTAPNGDGVPLQNGAEGKFRATFDLQLDQQGTYRIAELGATYFAQWQENGEPKRTRASLGWLVKEGITEKTGVKLMKAARRVETFVTLGAPSEELAGTTGKGLEMVPVTHPNDIYIGEEATLKFVLDGEPAADLDVVIIKGHDRYRDEEKAIKLKTMSDGSVSFTLDEPGRYWVSAASAAGTTKEQGFDMARRVSYNLTIEALAN